MTELGRIEERLGSLARSSFTSPSIRAASPPTPTPPISKRSSSPALSEIAQRLKATSEQDGAEAAVAAAGAAPAVCSGASSRDGGARMKIRAIRLKEVGRFSAPIAIEGLSGGLDVLVGPNEFGKSTILKAVKAALFDAHRSKHRKLEVLRPYAGGAPLIEVDFEVARQAVAHPQAVPVVARGRAARSCTSGSVTRGVDAEARLAELLGGAGHFALLCVDQGTPLAAMTPLETGGAAFMAAIESEVESRCRRQRGALHRRARQGAARRSRDGTSRTPDGRVQVGARRARPARERRQAEAQTAARARAGTARRAGDAARTVWLNWPTRKPRRRASTRPTRRGARSRRRARRARRPRRPSRLVASCEKHLGALKQALDVFDRRASERAKLQVAVDDSAPAARRGGSALRRPARRASSKAVRRAMHSSARSPRMECSRRVLELSERLEAARARRTPNARA